jgi:dihydroorotate dehydrogenase (fumarate)
MDLKTTYMGLELKNPLMVSACPLTKQVGHVRKMEDAGVSGVVMFSIFEEQVRHEQQALEHFLDIGSDSFGEALSYFPDPGEYRSGPDEYLENLQEVAAAVDIPVIASLNAVSEDGWTGYAKSMQEAGAAGIELNIFYIPTDLHMSGREVENRYLDILTAVKSEVTVPVAMKVSPYFSSMANMARMFDVAGADALVLFNRFYQPDFDIEKREVLTNLELSSPSEIRLPLLWIALLHQRINASLAATTGVHSAAEFVKYIMAGADAVQVASAVLKTGIPFLEALLEDVSNWMETHGYESIEQMKGSMSQHSVANPEAFERANYIKVLAQYESPYAG